MGFRSTFTTQDYNIPWPEWFRNKYQSLIWFREDGGTLSSVREVKTYMAWSELHDDIQKAIDWEGFGLDFVLAYLHECGGITRVQISRDRIVFTEPADWIVTKGVTHDYCYGCSDYTTAQQQEPA